MPETEAPQTKEPAVQVGDVWQSNGPKMARVRVLEITSLGLVRWSGITIRDAGAARDFARNRVLVERDGKPVGAEEPV